MRTKVINSLAALIIATGGTLLAVPSQAQQPELVKQCCSTASCSCCGGSTASCGEGGCSCG